MPIIEAQAQYAAALKAGQKCYREALSKGEYPYPPVLDEILDEHLAAGRQDLGVIDIPTDAIVGTKTQGRRNAFAANFMPLLPLESEFGAKWVSLCSAHLSSEGIREPIRCYEYLGRFYVEEGNKRASVLKSFDAPTISGQVTRILPARSDDEEIALYYEFIDFYRVSRLYSVRFSRAGSYRKLQAALGFEAEQVWTDDERKGFSFAYASFSRALESVSGGRYPGTAGDVFLLWLQLHSLSEIRSMSAKELAVSIAAVLPDARIQSSSQPIDVSTEPEKVDKDILSKLVDAVLLPGHLNVAFIHDRRPEESPWISAHELGREQLQAHFGEKLRVLSYFAEEGVESETLFDRAVGDGAQMIFATTPTLIGACRKAAAKYPDCKILNCSVSMPFAGVRTYYSRIYEGKFISGAVAGAMSKSGRLGYIASNPIYGVPAGINAFALGAQLTDPDARVILRWTCVSSDAIAELRALGCDVFSNRDVFTEAQQRESYGLCRAEADGALSPILSPVWNWGAFYIRIVQSVFSGNWEEAGEKAQRAVNYWWGLKSGVVDVVPAEGIPASMAALADILKRGVCSGLIEPFRRLIRTQEGVLVNDGERSLPADELLHIDWLCDCVEGSIPRFDELLDMSRPLVRLLGVYRDSIPPEKDGLQI